MWGVYTLRKVEEKKETQSEVEKGNKLNYYSGYGASGGGVRGIRWLGGEGSRMMVKHIYNWVEGSCKNPL